MGSLHDPLHEVLLEALPCEIIVYDDDTVVMASAATCRLIGTPSPRALLGLPVSALVSPAARHHATRSQVRDAASDLSVTRMRLSVNKLTGEAAKIDAIMRTFTIGPRRFACLTRSLCEEADCPQTAEMEFSYPEGTHLAKAALDALPMAVAAYNENDRIVYANLEAAEVLGAQGPDALIGQPLSVVIHPHTSEAAKARRQLALSSGQCFSAVEAKLRTVDGEPLRAIGSVGSAPLPDGRRIGYWMAHLVVAAQPAAE